MISIYVKNISLIAPGMESWWVAKKIFNKQQAYNYEKVATNLMTLLPANEARRASRTTKLALSAIEQLFSQIVSQSNQTATNAEDLSVLANHLHYIFTSCNGDLSIFHQISTALTLANRPVSPTKFHNSVHNAPAGYCAIALNAQSPSTSISGFEDSFANGLLEAAVQLTTSKKDCLLIAYDEVPPEPLLSIAPVLDEFSCALLLSKNSEQSICCLEISSTATGDDAAKTEDDELLEMIEKITASNPQAKAMPLLSAIARNEEKTVFLSCNQMHLSVKIIPL